MAEEPSGRPQEDFTGDRGDMGAVGIPQLTGGVAPTAPNATRPEIMEGQSVAGREVVEPHGVIEACPEERSHYVGGVIVGRLDRVGVLDCLGGRSSLV